LQLFFSIKSFLKECCMSLVACILLIIPSLFSDAYSEQIASEPADVYMHEYIQLLEQGSLLSEDQKERAIFLAEEYEVYMSDISKERIVLLLSNGDHLLVRVAQWEDSEQYRITDSGPLPNESYLDSFHDGNQLFLFIPTAYEEIENPDDSLCIDLFLTFQQLDDENWYLTDFTDGQSFTAALINQKYLFSDYYDASESYTYIAGNALRLEHFDVAGLLSLIENYFLLMLEQSTYTE